MIHSIPTDNHIDTTCLIEDSFRRMISARCTWCGQRMQGYAAGDRRGAKWILIQNGFAHNVRKVTHRELASIPRFKEAELEDTPPPSEVQTEFAAREEVANDRK